MISSSLHLKRQNNRRQGTNLLELLLALSILSAALYPIVYIFKLAAPPKQKTQTEYLATLLAHHVIETIVAKHASNPSFLPTMEEGAPLVQSSGSVEPVCEYFRFISESGGDIIEEDASEMFWSLKPFKCQIDTYYLDSALFKVIVYITYQQEGRDMKVFFERLLSQTSASEEVATE